RAALQCALSVQQRLFAPFLPFVAEEVWSWWREGSIHRATWPTVDEIAVSGGDAGLLADVSAALIGIRGVKSTAKVSMKTPLADVAVTGPAASLERLRGVQADLVAVGGLTGDITWTPDDAQPVSVTARVVEAPA
ncbi:MAG: valine--tRNA ligase, partial [Actinomycetia bacterium]|nr:valine--tRNA ligase [Actinomycetes bacterium]